MASSPPLLVDQTDDDLFNKLVDDDRLAGQSHMESEIMAGLYNMSLRESEDASSVSEAYGQKDNQSFECSLDSKNERIEEESKVLCEGATCGAKGKNVKEVEWSAYNSNSHKFELSNFESDSFFLSGYDSLANNSHTFSEPKTDLIENTNENLNTLLGSFEQDDPQVGHSFTSKQTADITEMHNWESIYPGWKYNSTNGQWYQVSCCDSTTNTKPDKLSVTNPSKHESIETIAFNTFNGATSETSDTVKSQETIHPVLKTMSDDGNALHSRNQIFQGDMQYPSNMVFDPQYPEWYYDTITQMWLDLKSYNHSLYDSYNATPDQITTKENDLDKVLNPFKGPAAEESDTVNLQQTTQLVSELLSEENNILNSRCVNYPPNMVFDPQYPEWYFDTSTQVWNTLESYNQSFDEALNGIQIPVTTNANDLSGQHTTLNQSYQTSHWNESLNGSERQSFFVEKNGQVGHWNDSGSGYGLPSQWEGKTNDESQFKTSGSAFTQQKMWQSEMLVKNEDVASFSGNPMTGSFNGSLEYSRNHPVEHLNSINLEPFEEHNYGKSNMTAAQSHATLQTMHYVKQPSMNPSFPAHISHTNYGTENFPNYSQQSIQGSSSSYSQFSTTLNNGRSTAGRPPHALVTFGFGGKILVMKDASFSSSSFDSGSQGTGGGVVLIHNLLDFVMAKSDILNTSTTRGFGYFHALCHDSFPGPLIGGNASSKDINKWINDKITSSESSSLDFQIDSLLGVLLSLLKILCQHYGRLRSPYGHELSQEANDGPESAVSKLFASAKRNNTPFGEFGSSMPCIKNPPSVELSRATAIEVQNLLISGRRKEALQRAQEGQLWGAAVVLAAQLGEQLYVDTVKHMALREFVCGSPLRTLYLLIAGQPAYVFSADSSFSGSSGAPNEPYQTSEAPANSMLDNWQENLVIISSNRTKDDELVIIHLGDCLLKERGEVTAAHICYLLAETNFEPYSDSSRLCLVGADHWKNPRTYACPESIQRTEIYEYSKVNGNSQFVLLPFQPYKIIYAYMLAEVGKISDSVRYCQASLKMLKNYGRSPEVELWRALLSSLEERLRTHQQGGYGANLAPNKLVGKLISSIDRSIHRIIGAPLLPPMPQNKGDDCRDNNSQVKKVSSSHSAMAITSLLPSPSVEAISEWMVDRSSKVLQNRSISEPDFGRSAKQNTVKERHASMASGPSRFGFLGTKLLQKTIGWVSLARHDRQAKLGESNKFYYDEKLKRWVEEGVDPPASEASLPPPPTTSFFQNSASDYDPTIKFDLPSEQVFGLPPIPPGLNQFSARGRVGVRSRYVDTFNKGGGSFATNLQCSPASSINPLAGSNFIPSALANYGKQSNTTPAITEEPSMPILLEADIYQSTKNSNLFAYKMEQQHSFISSTLQNGMPNSQSMITSLKVNADDSVMSDLHEVEL